jgi:uncharacterized membrane protein
MIGESIMRKLGNKSRIGEIDFLRGIALILMIYFHFIYDLNEILNLPVSYDKGIHAILGKVSGNLFIIISGVSASLSRNNFKRGLKVFLIGTLITGITYLYHPAFFIQFGILHFLGVSMMVIHPFMKIKSYLLFVIGSSMVFLGSIYFPILVEIPYLFPLGMVRKNFFSADYYPLIPYFGVFLMGVSLGKSLYHEKRSLVTLQLENNVVSRLGRHTLWIYLLHQPLIILVLSFLTR